MSGKKEILLRSITKTPAERNQKKGMNTGKSNTHLLEKLLKHTEYLTVIHDTK